MRALAAILVLGLGGGGCLTSAPPGTATAELGTGEWQFEPLADGQEVWIVNGAQGLQHIWVAFRTAGIDPSRVSMRVETRIVDQGGSVWEDSQVQIDLVPEGGDRCSFVGWPAVLSNPAAVADKLLHIRVTLTDRNGASAWDERTVLARWSGPLL